jgi:anhydro-N-acetylmuramic acid kinase
MPKLFQPDMPQATDGRRWTAGVLVSSRCTRIAAALVGAAGSGPNMLVEVAQAAEAEVPRQTVALFNDISGSGTGKMSAGAIAACRAQLADLEAALVNKLAATMALSASRILALGAHDPGLWDTTQGESTGYLGLCDAARLAESTGMNVVDAFPARDLALGGRGGPITAVAEWMLLRSQLRNRVLLDLGRTTRLTYMPAASTDRAETKVVSFEVGPGTAVLDMLVERLTNGQQRFDPGGRFAVQGHRIDELIRHWRRDPYFDLPPPRWHPRGVRPERFLGDALQMAVTADWSVRDLLCTATCFIAEMIADTLERRLPEAAQVDEIIVTGGGRQNGMLLRDIGRLITAPLVHDADLHMPAGSLEPACIGVLALLYMDQIPASHTAISQTETPRLLGRLTPGSPKTWKKMLETCAANSPAMRPLRSAM